MLIPRNHRAGRVNRLVRLTQVEEAQVRRADATLFYPMLALFYFFHLLPSHPQAYRIPLHFSPFTLFLSSAGTLSVASGSHHIRFVVGPSQDLD